MKMSSILVQNKQMSMRTLDEEILFLDPDGTAVYSTDEVGSFIYNQFDGIRSITEILGIVTQVYEVREETAEADLVAFANDLIRQKILLPLPQRD